MTDPTPPRRLGALAIPLLLASVTLLVFWPGLGGGFLFDDFPNLVNATRWRMALHDAGWRALLASDISGALGRPLAIGSFALNHALTDMDPFWFKLTNLGLHACNGVLVWRLCHGLFGDLRARGAAAPPSWVAVALALGWLVHPVQVSSVLYVIQRMEVGAAFCTLLSLLAYQRGRRAQIAGGRAWPWLAAWPLAAILGLGFKESALLAPGFALLIELCVFRFAGRGGTPQAWRALWTIAGIAGVAAFGLVTWHFADSAAWLLRDFGMGERLLTQPRVLVLYLAQLLVPLPESFHFYYDDLTPSRGLLSPPATLAAFALVAALVTAAVLFRRRWPLASLGIGWFLLAHALTSTVAPLELAFEHRNYLALLGVLLALVPACMAVGARLHADARRTLAAVSIGGLATLCAIQAAAWGQPMRLAWTLENRAPLSARAAYGLGEQLLATAGNDAADLRWSMAKGQFLHAANLPRAGALPLQAILVMHGRGGLPVPDGIWTRFREVLTARPFDAEATAALHAVSKCAIDGRCEFDDGELLATFMAVLDSHPHNAGAHTLYADFAWNRLGDQALAIRVQRMAVTLSRNDPLARVGLAKFLLASGVPACAAEGARIAEGIRRDDRNGRFRQELNETDRLRRLASSGDAMGQSCNGGMP